MNRSVKTLKADFPEGTLIELISMDDKQSPPKGARGVVSCVDDIGTIHVKWKWNTPVTKPDGRVEHVVHTSSLGLIVGVDKFSVVKEVQ